MHIRVIKPEYHSSHDRTPSGEAAKSCRGPGTRITACNRAAARFSPPGKNFEKSHFDEAVSVMA